ncbi:MAG: GuaB3 family IMP dehydrogenase-related protein [Dehalococcoidia bacterium]|nr:MAG: GuaB3 family IMP dehydrogenase-related protein [Dehalococcoidia bacterium]
MAKPKFRELRHAYGFDEVAIVPGDVTINPDQTDISYKIGKHKFEIPIIASAMDGVTDPAFAVHMGKLGGLAVLNLEGVQTRYDNPSEILSQIAKASETEVTALMQKTYAQPIREELITVRIKAIKQGGAVCAVAITPANTKRYVKTIVDAGADILVVASTVTSAKHISKSTHGLVFEELCKSVPIPVVVGNCVSYSACIGLMRTGIAAILVGVGPGAACTSREVLGIGVPQITATMDCAQARDDYFKESKRYVPIITDGGFRKGGDVCKAMAAGADAVMIGSIFAQAEGSPGLGYHWGMANPHASLPRGTRIKVGTNGTLEQILFGPTSLTHGSQNLVGALRTSMGVCGAANVAEFHKAEIVIAPAIVTEGKYWQMTKPTC